MTEYNRLRLGFLSSHGGSSMYAIARAIDGGMLDAVGTVVISNNANPLAFQRAAEMGLETRHISAKTHGSSEAADLAIVETMKQFDVELVILSGYMRKLGPEMLKAFPRRILNIHPALLPKFGGAGFYGSRVHEAVIAAGETSSGATIHLIDEQYDTGPIVSQRSLELDPGETAESLARRVGELELELYVDTLCDIVSGKIDLDGVG